MRASANSRILRGYSIDDIDMQPLYQYHLTHDIKHKNHPWTEIDDKQFLENIDAYREHLSDDTQIRWTNRIYPDETWEAYLYQFFTRVLPLSQHALPVPFSLDNNQIRNNTTTAHVALREALANSLIQAAYSVRGNIVIDRYFDRIVLSNPSTMLVSV